MKESKKGKVSFFVSEGQEQSDDKKGFTKERLKKPLVFSMMGVIFIACLYLIFGRGAEGTAEDGSSSGLNDAVPQASGNGLPEDKGKAYEQEMRREKDQQKREALKTLSDYWHPDSTATAKGQETGPVAQESAAAGGENNPSIGSYRSMQRSIGSFYQPDAAQHALKKENEELRDQLLKGNREERIPDRLQLMEQSYRMAAKYFPGAVTTKDTAGSAAAAKDKEMPFLEVLPQRRGIVSRLGQKVPDSIALLRYVTARRDFATAQISETSVQPANSIRACIHQGQKITGEGSVQLRLLEAARVSGVTLPKGYVITAAAKFQNSRLQLQVISIEKDGIILPVNLSVYDLDGQKGLNLPYAPEVTAVNSTIANMGNSAGGSFTINRSAGQQLTSDAARGLIQGVSGYFSKKVRPQKATLRAGYQLFLISKEK